MSDPVIPREPTQTEVDNLVAIATSGVTSVSHNGKTTSFVQTADEIQKRIDLAQRLSSSSRRVTLIKRAG